MSDPIDIIELDAGGPVPTECEAFLAGLRGPTIVHVRGDDRDRARVIAGTLHGNEPSGIRAIHRMLVEARRPAVDVWYFIGAVEAARAAGGFAHRMLPGRRDLNRCFRPPFDGRDGEIARRALEILQGVRPELVVDLHNNTGHNPAYGVGRTLGGELLALTAMFASTFVCSRLSLGTFSEAFAELAASITIECGRAGDLGADATALAGLQRLLQLPRIDPAVGATPMTILVDPVRVELRAGATIAFGDEPRHGADVTLVPDIDRHNFQSLAPGTALGWLRPGQPWPLVATDERGRECSRELFAADGDALRTRTTMVPMMATTNVEAARDDCLFYAASRHRSGGTPR